MASNNGKFTISEALKLFKNLPVLWCSRHKDFYNKVKREEAYEELARVLRNEWPNADIEFARCKMNALRSSYRKELSKVKKSKGKYTPTLWYFKKLLFLQENYVMNPEWCAREVYDLDNSNKSGSKEPDSNGESAGDESTSKPIKQEPGVTEMTCDVDPEIWSASSEKNMKVPSGYSSDEDSMHNMGDYERPLAADFVSVQLIEKRFKALEESILSIKRPDQKYDAFGMHIAEKMRGMHPEQAALCQKIMNDLIFAAENDKLNVSSHIKTIPRPGSLN